MWCSSCEVLRSSGKYCKECGSKLVLWPKPTSKEIDKCILCSKNATDGKYCRKHGKKMDEYYRRAAKNIPDYSGKGFD